MPVDANTFKLLMPEIILVVMAVWIYVFGARVPSRNLWSMIAAAAFCVSGLALMFHILPQWSVFAEGGAFTGSGPLAVDFFGCAVRGLAIVVGLLFALQAAGSAPKELGGEYLGSLLLVMVGVMLASSAVDLVLLFVSLELVSIPTYILLYLGRRTRSGNEAAAKYFFLSIFSSAILLYGFSFLYGLAGSTSLADVRLALAESELAPLVPFALILVFAGLGFKIAAVPFHFYAPDVYQGTTNANAGLLAVVPKIAGAVVLARLTLYLAPAGPLAWQLALVLSIITMTLGNACALWQSNIRRMLAYSSIAHSGYILMGITVALVQGNGIAAALLYVAVYSLASLGAFAALAALGNSQKEVSGVDDLAGLGSTNPLMAGVIAIFMFSLAGIPPLAGFLGKFALFNSAIEVVSEPAYPAQGTWLLVLAIVGALNAAIGAAYYLRVVAVMFFRSPAAAATPLSISASRAPAAASFICAALVILLGVAPGPVMRIVTLAEKSAGQGSLAAAVDETSTEIVTHSPAD